MSSQNNSFIPKITKNNSNLNTIQKLEYIKSIQFVDDKQICNKTIQGPIGLNSWEEIEELITMYQTNQSKIIFTFKCSKPDSEFMLYVFRNKFNNPWTFTYNSMYTEPRNITKIINGLFPNIKKTIQTPKPTLIKILHMPQIA
jgi:hypothetical protein